MDHVIMKYVFTEKNLATKWCFKNLILFARNNLTIKSKRYICNASSLFYHFTDHFVTTC